MFHFFLHINMPVMDGFECLRHLQETHPDLPVILASGFALQDSGDLALHHVDLIDKPYRAHDLLAHVRACLDNAALARAARMD